MKTRFAIALFLAVFFCLNVTVCSAAKTEKSDTLFLAIKGEPEEGYDPLLGWGRYGNPLFQSTLLKRDAELNIVPCLATEYTLEDDGLTYHVFLRDDVHFSDGSLLTAKDVVFTFNTAKKMGGKADLVHLDYAEAVSGFAVDIHLKQRDTTFINRLITLGIVPEASYSEEYGRHPVGSGPFMLEEWVEGQQMIAVANPHYFAEQPYFKKIVFLFTDEDTSFAAAKAGKVQMVVVPQSLATQTLPDMVMHNVRSVDNRGLMFPTVPDTGKKTAEGYPIGNNVTSDAAIRKAVNMALDRRSLVDNILEGYGRPAYGVCDGLPWDNPANVIKDSDLVGAAKLLEEAGWVDTDKDGIREKDGTKAEFTIVYPATRSIRQYLALACADTLQKIGVKVNVEGKSNFDEIKKIMHRDVVVFGWGSHDPIEMYQLYSSSNAGSGYNNPGYYKNTQVDANLDRAIAAASFQDSIEYWKNAQWDGETGMNARGDAPWAWLVNLDHTYFVHKDLDVGKSQVEPHGHGWPITANIENWHWIN